MCSNLPPVELTKCPEHPQGHSKIVYIGTTEEDFWVQIQRRFYSMTFVAIDTKVRKVGLEQRNGMKYEFYCPESFDIESIDPTVELYVFAAGEMNLKDGELRNLSIIELRPQIMPKKEYKF